MALPRAWEKHAQHTSAPTPPAPLQALVSAPGWNEIQRESKYHLPDSWSPPPSEQAQGAWGRSECWAPPVWWPFRAGSAQVCATPIPAGPRAAGAAEVHGDRGLLELRHLGLRVHHRLPAFPAQLAAGAVVSEARARPPGRVSPILARRRLAFPVSWGAPRWA